MEMRRAILRHQGKDGSVVAEEEVVIIMTMTTMKDLHMRVAEVQVDVRAEVGSVTKKGILKQPGKVGNIVAAEEKPHHEVKRYGVVDPGAVKGNATEVKGLVEKPDPARAPSNLCIIGRYILQPEVFAILDKQERGAGNEIQLTDAMAQMIGKTPFHAVKTDCARYDCGDKVGFLHANLAVGLSRPDIAPQLKIILKGLV